MKKLFVVMVVVLVSLFIVVPFSLATGIVYGLGGVVANEAVSQLGGYPFGEVTEPPPVDLVFVDGVIPTPGGSFTESDVESVTVWANPEHTIVLGTYLPASGETIQGSFSTTDITNGFPEIDLFQWASAAEVIDLNPDDTVTWDPNPTGNSLILTDAIFAALAETEEYTGIQITGLSSTIMGSVTAGETVTFTVNTVSAAGTGPLNFRFFTREGYELIADAANPWDGNPWELRQNWSTMSEASITFEEPGFFFVAVHVSEDTTWSAAEGGPQTGMVVEVWPNQ